LAPNSDRAKSRGNSIRPPVDDDIDPNNPKKKDTHKIRTNPRYRCVDDGSDDAEEPMLGKAGGEDLDALSSKELDFRETILKNEKKKKRKEKRLLER
jgi:hypothetical protein